MQIKVLWHLLPSLLQHMVGKYIQCPQVFVHSSPLLPVLLYSLSLASESAFCFLVAHLQTSVTSRGYRKRFGICSVFSIKTGPFTIHSRNY